MAGPSHESTTAEVAREVAPTAWQRELAYGLGPVVVLTLLALITEDEPRSGGLEPTILLVVLPLAFRRVLPLTILVVVSVGTVLTAAEAPSPWVLIGAVGLASFTTGERAADRTQSALAVIVVALAMAAGLVAQDAEPLEGLVLPFVVLVPTWLLGDLLRSRRAEHLRRAEAVERSLREREERLRAAASEERRHVARELHDVIAHAVSVMVIQAGAARQVLRSSPEQAEASLLAVESTGREAMTELRRFLGALNDDDEAAGLAPQPGIAELPTLLDRVREAGLPATLEVDGSPRSIPPSLDVTAYRIIQEALTNALRYARRAATLVRLSWESDQLRLEILDDGPASGAIEGSGRGLVGMSERAALVGGRVETGPRVGGGYAVRAWLPLEPGLSPLPLDAGPSPGRSPDAEAT
jgi:signal transduction histidine kinase